MKGYYYTENEFILALEVEENSLFETERASIFVLDLIVYGIKIWQWIGAHVETYIKDEILRT